MSNEIVNVYKALSGDNTKFKVFYFFFKSYVYNCFAVLIKDNNVSDEIFENIFHNTLTTILFQFKTEKRLQEEWRSKVKFDNHILGVFKKEFLSFQNLKMNVTLDFEDWNKLAKADTDIDTWLDEELNSIFLGQRIKKGKPLTSSEDELNETLLIAELNDYIENIKSPMGKMKMKLNIKVNKVSRGLPSNL